MVNSTGDSARRTVYVAPARNRGTNKRPALLGNGRLDINQTTCAPRLFRVRLESGNCSRRVLTKMCYGECTSYTFPRKDHKFARQDRALRAVETSCSCCSAVHTKTRRYDVICNVDGLSTRKLFFLPVVDGCSCRPCSGRF
ncbi:uncharacterized protein LOC134180605 [Corticium candelabrum]|uniref:uncharacterized protein LOC134180605 n=1 Tax=Corticium candelabrum TaxID=121492 RepID=UPI002E274421|nr:uncharacterized protein LOC134180605 [Corticium candelabrum]